MKYSQLGAAYREDVLAEALYTREVEYFHYDLDRANFVLLLKGDLDNEYRKLIKQRHAETLVQMERVNAIYVALQAQITDPEAHAAQVGALSSQS